MLEARGDRDLAQEALGTKLRGQLGAEDLDRDGPTGHPAPAEFSVDCVSRSERSLQLVELVSHVVPSAYTRNATVQQLRQAPGFASRLPQPQLDAGSSSPGFTNRFRAVLLLFAQPRIAAGEHEQLVVRRLLHQPLAVP